jgi:YHS domain-containing protein
MAECTVCGKELDAELMTEEREEDGGTIYLCCPLCQSHYDE